MIFGVGTDIVDISRIAEAIDRHGDKFIGRVFTKDEQTAAEKRGDKIRFYAMRFAAKEACWKALSPGRELGISWHDLEVDSTDQGQPFMRLHGKAADYFAQATDNRGQCHLSLSDDGGMALAFVTLSAP